MKYKMKYKDILFEIKNKVATLTLNRPQALNALTIDMFKEINDALDFCEKEKDVHVIVITGNGRAFCAGDDIKSMTVNETASIPEIADRVEFMTYPVTINKMRKLPKPIICAVNGLCYGAGGEIAMGCDYIIMSEDATFGQMYINVAEIGNTYLLPQQVGIKRAMEMLWSGRKITAQESLELGMINKIVNKEEILSETRKYAEELAKGPILAYGYAKIAIYESLYKTVEEGLHIESFYAAQLAKTKDHQEAVKAFIEKRKPVFTGE